MLMRPFIVSVTVPSEYFTDYREPFDDLYSDL